MFHRARLSTLGVITLFAASFTLHTEAQNDVRAFVSQNFVHGVPYVDAHDLGPNALPVLAQMLEEPSMEPYWMNVVGTIGYIGDSRGVEPLMEFVSSLRGELSVHGFQAVLTTYQSLGFLAARGSSAALDGLFDAVDSGVAAKQQFDFRFQSYQDDELGEVIARMAIQGLGISGNVDAYRYLQDLQAAAPRKDWSDNVAEALELNETVRDSGLESVIGLEPQR